MLTIKIVVVYGNYMTESIPIDKGVIIPRAAIIRTGPNRRYPWMGMGVGDSFMVTPDSNGKIGEVSVRTSAWMAGKRYSRKYSVAKVDGGLRVWRVA